jgi:polar amino acid transport system substrate-binding protein
VREWVPPDSSIMMSSMRIARVAANAALSLACLLACVAQAAGRSCSKVIIAGDPDYPPFSWYDGHAMHGAAVEIVQQAFEQAGIAYELRYVGPFNRVLQSAKNGTIDVIVELKDTSEREDYLVFSKTAIFTNPVAIFVRADNNLAFREWKDLGGLHGGITLGNKFGGGFDEFLAQSLTVESANGIANNFAKLELGRIDYFVNSYYPALGYLEKEHKTAQFKALRPFVTESSNYVGWSKSSPCLARLPDVNQALVDLIKSGEAKRVLERDLSHLQDAVVAPDR